VSTSAGTPEAGGHRSAADPGSMFSVRHRWGSPLNRRRRRSVAADSFDKPRVLVVISHYLPGFRAGGPVRSIEGLSEQLGGELDLYILTLDRDKGDAERYRQVAGDTWQHVGAAKVMYARRPGSPARLLRVIRSVRPDAIYLNTFFSLGLTVIPLLARRSRLTAARIILAPRGELSDVGMRLKAWKKVPFLYVLSHSGILSGITWQASTAIEAKDIHNAIGANALVVIAANLQRQIGVARSVQPKTAGLLRAVFVSRISVKKNLTYLLEVLSSVQGRVDLDIIGPAEDAYYWRRCAELIDGLPPHIAVTYRGEMQHYQVAKELAAHDLLVLPTMNENFGHVILEALSVGTPVLISDQTPWRDLRQHGAGWDISLSRPEKFRAALEECIAMNDERFSEMSSAASEQARLWLRTGDALEANRRLFLRESKAG
jgi:glycosyltransferase involved in cell wall biosynthesis